MYDTLISNFLGLVCVNCEIRERLTKMSNSSYLWAALAIEELRRSRKQARCKCSKSSTNQRSSLQGMLTNSTHPSPWNPKETQGLVNILIYQCKIIRLVSREAYRQGTASTSQRLRDTKMKPARWDRWSDVTDTVVRDIIAI